MILKNILALLLLILVSSYAQKAEYDTIPNTNYILYPQVTRQKVPLKSYSKLLFQNYTTLIHEVNFELSSYLYMREGILKGDDAYDPQKYEGYASKCRLYKTDLKSRQYRETGLKSRPKDLLIIQKNSTETGVVATIYTVHENYELKVVDVKIQNELKGVGMGYPYWGSVPFLFNQRGSFMANMPQNSVMKLLNIDQDLFLLSDTVMYRLKNNNNIEKMQKVQIEGWLKTSGLVKVERIADEKKSGRKRFFSLGANQLNMYEVVSETEINLAVQVSNFSQNSKLLSAVYDRGYYYVTALDILYVINTNNQTNIQIKYLPLNGTCDNMQMFQTTLHLSCSYNKINYIVEFFALGFDVRVNRYYGGEDIQGRTLTRRIGMGRMAILTDNEIKIIGYGINKNVLLQFNNPQPQFTFAFRYGWDLIPITIGTNEAYSTMIIFSADKMAILQFEQVPPELFCEFPEDKVGTNYQILLQFNTSRCSYIQKEQDLFYGNMETVCEISIPIVLSSKSIQMESKHSNLIMLIVAMLISGVAMLIAAVIIKHNRSLEEKFNRMQKQLDRARKGYGKDKAVSDL